MTLFGSEVYPKTGTMTREVVFFWSRGSKYVDNHPELHCLRWSMDGLLTLEMCYLNRVREWTGKNNGLSTL